MSDSAKQLRTIDVEPDEHMLIKPGELIDIVELSPLTLQDRRIYNLLILNAWDSITEPKEHRIHKRDLRGTPGCCPARHRQPQMAELRALRGRSAPQQRGNRPRCQPRRFCVVHDRDFMGLWH